MSELIEFRKSKDEFFKQDHHAPLTPDQQRSFKGLSYYDENRSLKIELKPTQFEKPEMIEMQTSTGDVAKYYRWATVSFEVDSQPAQLTLYKDIEGDDFFLPFTDATSGKETYPAGRYLETHALSNGNLLVDFNYAYNPYCAYNEMWSCPLTPFENRLQVPIRAGEKTFK
jgi:uncharacterized protein (DUF1684 family)